MSPEGLAILSGADLIKGTSEEPIYVHQTSQVEVKTANTIVLPKGVVPCWNGGRKSGATDAGEGNYTFHKEADIFCMKLNSDGEIDCEPCVPASVSVTGTDKEAVATIVCHADGINKTQELAVGDVVLVDYYVAKKDAFQVEITADKFAGNFYIEGETLFRRESDGVDMPAELIIPNGKIQSNFNLTFSNSGDPAVFDFTVDCFPAYTKFNKTKKMLGLIQVIDESSVSSEEFRENCVAG